MLKKVKDNKVNIIYKYNNKNIWMSNIKNINICLILISIIFIIYTKDMYKIYKLYT